MQLAELKRLYERLPDLGENERQEIGKAFDRLVAKILHPPLESLRDESHHESHPGLLEALQRLFQLKD